MLTRNEVYQINGHCVRVIAESYLPVEQRSILVLPGPIATLAQASTDASNVVDATSLALNLSSLLPLKRKRKQRDRAHVSMFSLTFMSSSLYIFNCHLDV
jgi:hypothetical protein